jgi:hypothetical protein
MNPFKILNVGFSNIVITDRIVSIIHADSASGRRLKNEAKNTGVLVDATNGRKTKSVIITDSKHLILSSLKVETLFKRLEREDNSIKADEDELD